VPRALDHRGKALVRVEALPLEALFPALEEGAGVELALVVPELAEGLLQQIRSVQPAIGLEELLQAPSAIQGKERDVFAGEDGAELLSAFLDGSTGAATRAESS